MNRTIAVSMIALAGLAVGGALWASSRSMKSDAPAASASDGPFFPELAAKGDSAAEIVVKRPELSFTVRLDGGVWRVVEKANYPAKLDVVRGALVGLSQLRGAEAKTARAENFAKLGVEEPVAPAPDAGDKPMPQSTLVTVKAGDGGVLASAIVGNTKWGNPPGVYARRAGESQAYLVSGRAEVPREAVAWLETEIANVARDRVKSVVVTRSGVDGVVGTLSVSREKPSDSFALAGVPAGRELKDPGYAEQLGTLLNFATLQDVRAVSEVEFTPAAEPEPRAVSVAEVRTFDGLVVKVEAVGKEGREWWRLSASVDESVEGLKPADGKPTDALETLKKEAADLNARWAGFAYAPGDFKARLLVMGMSELLKEPASAAPPPSPTADQPVVPAQ